MRVKKFIKRITLARRLSNRISKKNLEVYHHKVLNEAMSASSIFLLIMSFVYFVYSFISFSYIVKYDPSITITSNTIPRFLFNTLPCWVIAFVISHEKINLNVRHAIWIIAFPLILTGSAFVNIWPIALEGKRQILFHVHAANFVLYSLYLLMPMPPSRYIKYYVMSFAFIFLIAFLAVSYDAQDNYIFKQLLNEWLIVLPMVAVSAYKFDAFRLKSFLSERKIEKSARTFLGPTLSKAIYENKKSMLADESRNGVILCLDIRSYTELANHITKTELVSLTEEYFKIVSTAVERYHGFLNKTSGDGHLVTFGIMDERVDLSDIPGIENDITQEEINHKKSSVERALACVYEIFDRTESLSCKYKLPSKLIIGGALEYGSVRKKVVGSNTKKELDIFGNLIIRCTRLESYTKYLIKEYSLNTSTLISTRETLESITLPKDFKMSVHKTDGNPVRDFSGLTEVIYCYILSDKESEGFRKVA